MRGAARRGALLLTEGDRQRMGAFTPSRRTVLALLAGQAAISLENARLALYQLVRALTRRPADQARRCNRVASP